LLRKPFGRRVYSHSYWELSRRVYFDTRFELDVDVDADNDSTDITAYELACLYAVRSMTYASAASPRSSYSTTTGT
jgi:hypothetical protein